MLLATKAQVANECTWLWEHTWKRWPASCCSLNGHLVKQSSSACAYKYKKYIFIWWIIAFLKLVFYQSCSSFSLCCLICLHYPNINIPKCSHHQWDHFTLSEFLSRPLLFFQHIPSWCCSHLGPTHFHCLFSSFSITASTCLYLFILPDLEVPQDPIYAVLKAFVLTVSWIWHDSVHAHLYRQGHNILHMILLVVWCNVSLKLWLWYHSVTMIFEHNDVFLSNARQPIQFIGALSKMLTWSQ